MSSKIKIFRVVTVSNCVPWHLSNFLDKGKEDYKIYVLGDKVSAFSEDYNHVTFIDIPIARDISILSDLKALFLLVYYCIRYRPNIVHSIMPKAGLLSALAGFLTFIPLRFHTFTGQVWYEHTGLFRKFLIFLDKLIVFLNTECLTDSPSQSNYLFENNIKNKISPLNCLGSGALNGVNENKFDKIRIQSEAIQLKKDLAIKEQDFVFSFIARKNNLKGIRELLEAFSIISNKYSHCRLVYLGPEDKGQNTVPLLDKLNIREGALININRSVNNHEVYLAISNVLCLPSYREGFGSIVIDAATIGVPTIGTRIVGLVDSIQENETGLLVEVASVDSLVEAMEKLILDTEFLEFLSKNAEIRARKYFNAEYIYSLQKELYASYLKNIISSSMNWLCSFKAYGDLVIACNVLNRITDKAQWGLIYGSYNRELLQAIGFEGKTVELNLGNEVPAAYNLKKEGFWRGLKSAWQLKKTLNNLHYKKDILLFDRLIKRTRLVSLSYQTQDVYRADSNIYKDYFQYFGIAESQASVPAISGKKIYIFPTARNEFKTINTELTQSIIEECLRYGFQPTLIQVAKETPTHKANYTEYIWGFDTLVGKIKEADLIISADSLAAHLAEYYHKPVFVKTPVENPYWMPLSALKTGAVDLFDTHQNLAKWLIFYAEQ